MPYNLHLICMSKTISCISGFLEPNVRICSTLLLSVNCKILAFLNRTKLVFIKKVQKTLTSLYLELLERFTDHNDSLVMDHSQIYSFPNASLCKICWKCRELTFGLTFLLKPDTSSMLDGHQFFFHIFVQLDHAISTGGFSYDPVNCACNHSGNRACTSCNHDIETCAFTVSESDIRQSEIRQKVRIRPKVGEKFSFCVHCIT